MEPTVFEQNKVAKPVKPAHVVASLYDSWSLERLLGSGSQGEVWLARERRNHSQVAAVKLMKNSIDARHECDAYDQLRQFVPHPHVLEVGFGITDGCVAQLRNTRAIPLGPNLCCSPPTACPPTRAG